MSGSISGTRGLLAAGLSLIVVFILGSCSDNPLTPRNEQHAAGVPQMALSAEFDQYDFLGFVKDDQGANDEPAQSDLNAFTRADNVSGKIGVKWVWDDVNSWAGAGQTGDACALFDTDNDTKANAAVCVRINNPDGDPNVVAQLGSGLVYTCGDSKPDRCAQPANPALLNGTICEVEKINGETFFAAGDDGADVLAACSIPFAAISASATPNLLNVCSFPSGSPNSNPFDCVVTPGAGFLIIKKATTPDDSKETFSFTISPVPVGGANHSLTDNATGIEQTALLSAAKGTYSVTEGTLPTGWLLDAASCALQTTTPTPTGTKTGNAVNGILIESGETTVCTFTNIAAAPSLTVVKSASPTSIPETGDSVSYSVQVTNTSAVAGTLTALTDDNVTLHEVGDCETGGTINAGITYSCTFKRLLPPASAGQIHVDTVRATLQTAGGSASAQDSAKVTYTDVAPTITVLKTAQASTVPETGGDITYDVLVTNNSAEQVTVTSLTDDKFGNVATKGTCTNAIGAVIAANGGTYSCAFTGTLSAANAGTTHTNKVTVTVVDNDDTAAQDDEDEIVTYADVAPGVTVTKTASPTSVPETGDSVTFSVSVENTSAESVTLTSLVDNVFGNLNSVGTCVTGGSIDASDTYSCSFKMHLSGAPTTTHQDTVTAVVTDNDATTATGSDSATVTFTEVLPDITVTKSASKSSIGGSGGAFVFAASDTFPRGSSGGSVGGSTPVFAASTCDDAGANDEPAQVDLNCFSRADNVSGFLGVRWSWDDINSWTGSGQTGDACALLDTDGDGNTNFALCARVTNTADGSDVLQVPGSPILYQCNDTKTDRCAKQTSVIANIGQTDCTISTTTVQGFAAGEDGADTLADCVLQLSVLGTITSLNLLNVCSYPSGEPNSNAFDCVVTPGVGFMQIRKVTLPDTLSAAYFGFTMNPASTDASALFLVQSGATSAAIPATPGTNYSLLESSPVDWDNTSVTCTINNVSTGTVNGAGTGRTGIEVKQGQTTICTFTNTLSLSDTVTFTVTVTNNSNEAVTLFSLNDSENGGAADDLNGDGTCVTGGTILKGTPYSCTFTRTLTGAPGDPAHKNIVTAVGKDNENNSDSDDSNEVSVTFGP